MKKDIWLIGPGNIGLDYAKVLIAQGVDFKVIGRSPAKDWPVPVFSGGVESFVELNSANMPYGAIVAVDESQLYPVTKFLIISGVKNILIEKPGSISKFELHHIKQLSSAHKCNLFIAYNRRFYQSVKKCKELISSCNEPISVNFTFTEWSHLIDFDSYNNQELERFFLCNSSHVPDTVFYLCGSPVYLDCITKGSLDWHPSASVFSGSGVSQKGVAITYNANWSSAGRWGIEIDLPEHKLILRPLEKLQIQKKGELKVEKYKLNNEYLDTDFKPGLFEEVRDFINDQKDLCSINEQIENFKWYYKIANY